MKSLHSSRMLLLATLLCKLLLSPCEVQAQAKKAYTSSSPKPATSTIAKWTPNSSLLLTPDLTGLEKTRDSSDVVVKPLVYKPGCFGPFPVYKKQDNEDHLIKFIARNVRRPAGAERICVEGNVFIGLIIDEEGGVRDLKILKGLHPLFDAEALRVVKLLDGQFDPAIFNGKPIPIEYIIPVRFSIP